MSGEDPVSLVRSARGLLVDTNLLLLATVHRVDPRLPERFKRTQSRLLPGDGELLLGVLKTARQLVCTPHVLAETSNFLGQLGQPRAAKALEVLLSWMLELDEREVPVRAMSPGDSVLARRLGVTDAALVHLTRSGLVLLTDDAVLANAARVAGGVVLNFTHLRRLD